MIDFQNVSKVYDGKTVLKNASLKIEDGEFVFICGPTGSGKSTLIKLISREIEPDEGKIFVNGKNIAKLSNREIPAFRRQLGMVFQDFRLLPNMTVFENVAFAKEVTHSSKRTINRMVPQLLAMVGIDDLAKQFPDQISGGEQQRVAIARAIANNPKYIIADEPTGNLDPETAWAIMELLDQINRRGTTVLMVTHAEEIVKKMHKRVVTINGGVITSDVGGPKKQPEAKIEAKDEMAFDDKNIKNSEPQSDDSNKEDTKPEGDNQSGLQAELKVSSNPSDIANSDFNSGMTVELTEEEIHAIGVKQTEYVPSSSHNPHAKENHPAESNPDKKLGEGEDKNV